VIVVVIIIIIIRSESKHWHACFRRTVGQSPQCRLHGTVVSVIIVFVLHFFVSVSFQFSLTKITLQTNSQILQLRGRHCITRSSAVAEVPRDTTLCQLIVFYLLSSHSCLETFQVQLVAFAGRRSVPGIATSHDLSTFAVHSNVM